VSNADGESGDREVLAFDLYGTLVDPIAVASELGQVLGDADGRDALNRYYNYPSPDWLRANYANAGNWSSLSIETGEVTGFDGKRAAMLFVTARKSL